MNKKQLLWAWLLALMLPATLSAQTWTASAPADGTFYLYNVGRQGFVYGGNDHDTRVSLTQKGGVAFTLAASGEGYNITSTVYQNLFLGGDGYVDKLSTSSSAKPWKFIPVSGMGNTFMMQTTKDSKYLVAHATDVTKTSVTSTQPTDDMGYWRLVSRADYIAGMAKADADNPVDATKLFQNPYIGRVTDASCWQGSPAFNGVDGNWCFEKYNTTFDVYQEIEGVPNGIYTLKCQGFYRMGSRTNAANNRNAGTEALNAKYYINTAEGSLKSIFDYSQAKAFADGYNENAAYTVNDTAYYLPNTHAQAANNCRKDEYWNDPIRVVVTDGKLRIGVKKTVAVGSDWTIFDNFVVTYYGVDMTAMVTQALASWHSKYDVIANQALDHSAYDAVLDEATVTAYCTTEEKLAEYDGIVWQTVCNLLTNGTPANGSGQFDITSLVENPTFDTSVAGWDVTGTAGINATYGVAEFFNQPDVSLTQTLANMPAGTYTLKAQAFYRSTAWPDATYYYRQGTDVVKANFLLGNQSVPVCNIYDQSRYQPAYLSGNAGGSNQKMAPNSMHGASAAFDIGQYWNLLSTTTDAAGNLTFGLNIVGGLENDWMCFDNFRLYYGAAAAVVDLTSAMPTEDTQASTVTTGITLTAGDYNKVCLPFDLDAAQTAAAFSAAYTLGGVTADGVAQLVPAYTIEAGRAYFVTVDATKSLAIDSPVRIRVAQPDSIPVMWEGAATVGKFDGFTFDVNLSDGYSITSYAPVDLQNMAFTVNQENWRVRRFLNEFTYDENTASKIRAYNVGYPVSLDQPHSVFIPVPQNNAVLTVTVSKNADYSEAETFSFAAGTTLCEVPNLIPQNTYYYKVEAGGSVITKGQFTTEGRIRMIKANSGINIRDLGGWETLDGNHLRYGKIFRGAELNYGTPVSAADLAELRRLGIGAELDFRYTPDTNNETPAVSALGNDAPYLFFDQTYADASPTNFISDKDIYRQAFQLNLEQLRSGVATYFHCRIGADRTGSYALLVEGLCGVTLDQFAKDYELTTFSKSGTREWNQPGYNLLGKLEDINAFPGNTLQQKFFYYMNHELGIPAADLFEFIELMVEGDNEKSLTNSDLAFATANGSYLQSADGVAAICANGSTIVSGAKARLSDGTTTTDIDMSIDAITLSFGEMTLEAGKDYTLTIPAGAIEKGDEKNAEAVTLSFHTPYIFDGIYYLYSQSADGFLSAGNDFGTSACVDRYGLPLRWTVDNEGHGTFQYLPSQLYLYGPNWVYVNGEASEAVQFEVDRSAVEGFEGYQLRNIAQETGHQHLYTRLRTAANYATQYGRVAANGNLAEGGNCDNVEWTVWQFYTPAQQQAKLAADREAETLRAVAAAGIAAESVADFDQQLAERFTATTLTNVIATHASGGWTAGSTWNTQDDRLTYLNVYNTGSYGGEIYEKNCYLEQTVTVPHPGLYRIDLHALMRQARRAYCFDLGHQGIEPSTAYIEANGYRAQIPAWYSDCTEDKKPDNVTETQELFDAGKYALSLYTYVADDCKLTLRIAAESLAQMQWCIFSDPTLTALVPKVTISENATKAPAACDYANVTLERTLQPEIWNNFSVPFDLTADQISNSALAGATIYGFKQSDTENITFQTVTAIEAGKPYLVRLADTQTENVVNPAFAGVSIVSAEGETQGNEGSVQFVGQIYNKPLAGVADVCYLSTATQKLKKLSADGAIKGLRCYFIVPGASTTAAGIKLIFDTPTGIEELETTNNEVHSTDVVYDLQGRRVATPAKGIYIVNGKKVYVK
jgi:protein tyrosine/serine phosphatase